MLDVLLDAFIDSIKMLPFLFGAYLLIEFLEHKASGKLANSLQKLGPFGPIGGAAIGCIPQCGFSVAASNLYAGRLITIGTLMAVYISTSDEAIPIMIAHPNQIGMIWKLLLIKVILATAAGILIDIVIKIVNKKNTKVEEPFVELCSHCGCDHSITLSALKHTLNIFIFILIVNLFLNGAIQVVGEHTFTNFLQSIKIFQPAIAGLVGLIPNCAASVILTQLYVEGGLTFGSLIAGLSTGAGLGVVVLFRANKNLKQNLLILVGLYIIGTAAGMIIDVLGFAGV